MSWAMWKRAVGAEAEIDRLRAELADIQNINAKTWAALQDRDAAIARVRELCDRCAPMMFGWNKDILRALDGGTE